MLRRVWVVINIIHYFLVCLLLNTALDVLVFNQHIRWFGNIILSLVAAGIYAYLRHRKIKRFES
jgi:hypothetical protein